MQLPEDKFVRLELCDQWGYRFLSVAGTKGDKQLRFNPPRRADRFDVKARPCGCIITVRWPDGTVTRATPVAQVEIGESSDHGRRSECTWERYFVEVTCFGAKALIPLEQLDVHKSDVLAAENGWVVDPTYGDSPALIGWP